MKKILLRLALPVAAGLLLVGCRSTFSEDFGCKCGAVYGNYDTMQKNLEQGFTHPEQKALLEETPLTSAYYHQMYFIALLRNGLIPEALAESEISLKAQEMPLTRYFRAIHYLRESDPGAAARELAALDILLAKKYIPPINYYQFLLAREPDEPHDKMLKMTASDFLNSRANRIRKELESCKNMPAGISFVFRDIQSESFRKLRFGALRTDAEKQLGKPDFVYAFRGAAAPCMKGRDVLVYQLPEEGKVVELYFSRQTNRLGDVRILPESGYRPRDGKRDGPTWFRPKDAPFTLGTISSPETSGK